MRILAIETSCDETAVSLLEAEGTFPDLTIRIHGNALLSQVELHAPMGGVVPMLAKREHGKNLIPLLKRVLEEARALIPIAEGDDRRYPVSDIEKILEREPELLEQFLTFAPTIKKPEIDAIAVTSGPGLEPALWVGINCAKALGALWQLPVIPVNHMEGHLISSVLTIPNNSPDVSGQHRIYTFPHIQFPAVALLISGGHTEIVLAKDWMEYTIAGETRDDAVGEAFDKVARLLGLSYPGGPHLAALARLGRPSVYSLPRPMIGSDDLDFSFSGLKTAVLYLLKKLAKAAPDDLRQGSICISISDQDRADIAREFEDSVVDVLAAKMRQACTRYGARTIILGGGVSANTEIRTVFEKIQKQEFPDAVLSIPDPSLSTDNAVMIALAALMRASKIGIANAASTAIAANGSLRLGPKA